ncbi:hypothetical protein AAVH_25947 [Aphelenchoides avenae]|nr:hypothetical protein AAVH_25947 [Aphelenchus avenae]
MSREQELSFLVVQYGIEAPLVTCSLIVNFCIYRQLRKRNPSFMTGFYVLYMLQATFDLLVYVVGAVYRLSRFGLLPTSLLSYPVPNIAHILVAFLMYMQCFLHAAIAFNRYTAIAMTPTNSGKLFRGTRGLMPFLLCSLAIAFPSSVFRVASKAAVVETPTPGLYAVVYDSPRIILVHYAIAVAIVASCAFVAFVFEVLTIVAYRRLTNAARTKYKEDVRLLVYAVFQLFVQLAMTTVQSLLSVAAFNQDRATLASLQRFYSFTFDVFCFSRDRCRVTVSDPAYN